MASAIDAAKKAGLDPANGYVNPADGVLYLSVPAGEFTMGSDAGGGDDEKPAHSVYLDDYLIMRTEVTNAQYARCVAASACTSPHEISSRTNPSYYDNAAYADYPVIKVNWSQAEAFCVWAGGRLPTEAEWEKAARGADRRIYPGGDTKPDGTLANFNSNKGDTTVVGNYVRSARRYIYYAISWSGVVGFRCVRSP